MTMRKNSLDSMELWSFWCRWSICIFTSANKLCSFWYRF